MIPSMRSIKGRAKENRIEIMGSHMGIPIIDDSICPEDPDKMMKNPRMQQTSSRPLATRGG